MQILFLAAAKNVQIAIFSLSVLKKKKKKQKIFFSNSFYVFYKQTRRLQTILYFL